MRSKLKKKLRPAGWRMDDLHRTIAAKLSKKNEVTQAQAVRTAIENEGRREGVYQ